MLLTGASGFVGAAVMARLLDAGYRVRALVRRPAVFPAPEGVTVCAGDVTDLPSILQAAQGCEFAIHCAADYRLSLRRAETSAMVSVNVGGTANLLEAASAVGIRRLVHCSTVGTLAFERSGRVCAEADTCPSPALLAGPYKRSKWAAERLALGHSYAGLEVVVVQPSTPVGRGDRRPTPTGQTIRDFLRGRIPAVVDTGLNLVHIDDCAAGHLLAEEKGRIGERYILGGENLTLLEILTMITEEAGRKPPRIKVTPTMMWPVAWVDELLSRVFKKQPRVTRDHLRMARHKMYFSSEKAIRELGYAPRPVRPAIKEAVAWFLANNMVAVRT